jgi:hypothetical protein
MHSVSLAAPRAAALLCLALAATPCLAQTPAAAPGRFNPDLSLTLQGLYKDAGAVEPEITGFLPAGHAHGGEAPKTRGFLLGESELLMSANIDQLFKGQLNLAISEHEVEVEEAFIQTLAMGQGMTLKAGRFLSGFGYLNEQHPHAWDFADAPLMQRVLFGEHGYGQDGLQLKWVAPTPLFLELTLEGGRGANFPGTDRNKNGSGAGLAGLHVGGDFGSASAWRAGVSALRTSAVARDADLHDASDVKVEVPFTGESRVTALDFVWKWKPSADRGFKLQGEVFRRKESGTVACDDADPLTPSLCSGGLTDRYESEQSGGYLQAIWQFAREWRVGARLDRLDSGTVTYGPAFAGVLANADYQPKRSTLMADWSPSEFSRLRLQYARDQSQQGLTDRQVTLQYVMTLGAHGAHRF